MSKYQNYYMYVREQAESVIDEHKDNLVETVMNGDTDVHEFFGDTIIHEWVDSDFIYNGLLDHAQILDQSDEVETDSGLWEGQEPMKAIETQAFFTFRNDLHHKVIELAENVLEEKATELDEKLDSARLKAEQLREKADLAEDDDMDTEADEAESVVEKLEEEKDYIDTAIEGI